MSESESSSSTAASSFCGLLTLLFIGLKLTDHIDWGWNWVLSPLWIPITIFASVALVVLFFLALAAAYCYVRGD